MNMVQAYQVTGLTAQQDVGKRENNSLMAAIPKHYGQAVSVNISSSFSLPLFLCQS